MFDRPVDSGLMHVVLSDFAGQKAQSFLKRRAVDYVERVDARARELESLRCVRRGALTEAKIAFLSFDVIKALGRCIDACCTTLQIRRLRLREPVMRSPCVAELQAVAGEDAEKRFDRYLAARLDAKWTLISGYAGRGGEIDRILVGPFGIFSFEIKGNRGVICTERGRWYAKKYNRRGDLVETKALQRSPDQQLNKATKWLAGWLKRNGVELPVTRIVLFTAPDAKINRICNHDVSVVTTLSDLHLEDLLARSSPELWIDQKRVEIIVGLIRRDHVFCEEKGGRG